MKRTTELHIEILNLAERLKTNSRRPILFLGAGCSINAGLPSEADLIKQVGQELGRTIDSLVDLAKILRDNSDLRRQISQQLSAPGDTSAFEKLACLVAEGYFHTILTSNWDFLIETSLSHFLSPDKYRVYVRGQVSDNDIASILRQQDPLVKIVKLHGDLLALPMIDPLQLMNFGDQLERQLERMINDDDVVIIGYGFKEPRFHKLLNNNTKPIVVDPFQMPDTFLRGLGGGAVQVHGEDGKFSSFVGDLCSLLLAQDYRVWIEDSKPTDGVQTMASIVVREHGMVNKAVDHIRDGIEASDVVEERVKELAKEMLRSIRERFHDAMISKGGVCLIFINDPCTPGGTEIERLIIDDPDLKKEISKMDLESVEITNRVTHTGPRNVKHWERHGHTKALIEYGAVVLIDSIAFTGNTFEVARAYLSKVSHRAKEKFTAAVLFMPSETKRKLKPQGKWWDVISPGSDYNGFDITFPWGWTTATQPVLQHTPADPFIPRDGFSFTPKPWGDQLTFCSGERASVSLLLFERGQRTSIHYHLLRNETFVVLDSRIRVCVWNRYLELRKHQSIRIPAGVPHSLIALDQPCRVLEIATGYYDAANDIVRLVDIYARKTRPDGSDDGLK